MALECDTRTDDGENTSCVNPEHLQPLTHREHARISRITRLNPDAVRDIRRRTDAGETQASVAALYVISEDYVGQIHRRKQWTDVPEEA